MTAFELKKKRNDSKPDKNRHTSKVQEKKMWLVTLKYTALLVDLNVKNIRYLSASL